MLLATDRFLGNGRPTAFAALCLLAALRESPAARFGVEGIDLGDERDPLASLDRVLAAAGPSLVRVPVPEDENVLPMVPPGAANRDMIEGGTADE